MNANQAWDDISGIGYWGSMLASQLSEPEM